jgi:hypothetical protein
MSLIWPVALQKLRENATLRMEDLTGCLGVDECCLVWAKKQCTATWMAKLVVCFLSLFDRGWFFDGLYAGNGKASCQLKQKAWP